MSKQLDNFKQMLNAMQGDIRGILIKLADRLHNMRTLASMRTDKQMKIAGETDYFYAPLANRLGYYEVKPNSKTSPSDIDNRKSMNSLPNCSTRNTSSPGAAWTDLSP